jgi:hypothetical protein
VVLSICLFAINGLELSPSAQTKLCPWVCKKNHFSTISLAGKNYWQINNASKWQAKMLRRFDSFRFNEWLKLKSILYEHSRYGNSGLYVGLKRHLVFLTTPLQTEKLFSIWRDSPSSICRSRRGTLSKARRSVKVSKNIEQ